MMVSEKVINLSRKIVGYIASEMALIDIDFTNKLNLYFFPKTNKKSTIFCWEIMNTFSLENKIKLFRKIPYFKKRKGYEKILESLDFLKEFRNNIVHGDIRDRSNIKQIIFYNPAKTIHNKRKNKEILVTKEVIEKVNDHLFNFHYYLCKNHKIDRREFTNPFNEF